MVGFVIDQEHPVTIPSGGIMLQGLLHIPKDTQGIVLFAHGSGSSRLSPRNQMIAKTLQDSQFATLLFDLLTDEEESVDELTRQYRFDIELLSLRLIAATNWVLENKVLSKLPIGYFGASTGGAAAIKAAALKKEIVKAVVSRGGRPDLAGVDALREINANTLLIVGGNDFPVIELNEAAYAEMNCVKELILVPGATHLFEERGALTKVAELSKEWFKKYLA